MTLIRTYSQSERTEAWKQSVIAALARVEVGMVQRKAGCDPDYYSECKPTERTGAKFYGPGESR